LSAIEGIKLMAPSSAPYVVPITVVILLGLFAVQSRGTHRVAAFFGPIMLVWFLVIGLASIPAIASQPEVLLALNPLYAASFMIHHGIIGFVTLGAVFLAVTGAEALYADLGHFGKKPIQTAWLFIVLPALVLNYLGQGALVISDPKVVDNPDFLPFYLMFPEWARGPMVVLAAVATLIASQAVISGAHLLAPPARPPRPIAPLHVRPTSAAPSRPTFIPPPHP